MIQITSPPLIVVMGVSGVGKTSIGTAIAERLGVAYADGDEFHPAANIAKMSRGEALHDDDRWPWLRAVGAWLADHDASGAVVSCSALRRAYRDVVVGAAPRVAFVHLDGDHDMIRERIASRRDHYMPASLLDSQLATLEPLADDEHGVVVDVAPPADEVTAAAMHALGLTRGARA